MKGSFINTVHPLPLASSVPPTPTEGSAFLRWASNVGGEHVRSRHDDTSL